MQNILWFKLVEMGIRGKCNQFNLLNVTSRVKFGICVNTCSDFTCYLGVRQGECLPTILFSMYLIDIKMGHILKGVEGIDFYVLKLFLLLYGDDIISFAGEK